MRSGTIIFIVISAALHVGLATGMIAVAQKREMRRRAIQVAVTGEKKKEAKPKPPPPPKPISRPAPPKVVAAVPKAGPAPAAVAHAAAPVATNLTMSNTDSDTGPGIGLGAPAPKPIPAAAAAPKAVASAISERRTKRTQEESGAADAPCEEEPTKPQPVFKTEVNYSLYPQAQQDGIEGKFRARLIVDANGEVTSVEVVKGIDPGLDAAIVASLKNWRFKPSTACGKPVAGGTYLFGATFELAN